MKRKESWTTSWMAYGLPPQFLAFVSRLRPRLMNYVKMKHNSNCEGCDTGSRLLAQTLLSGDNFATGHSV